MGAKKDRYCNVCGKVCYGHECEDCYKKLKYRKLSRWNRKNVIVGVEKNLKGICSREG